MVAAAVAVLYREEEEKVVEEGIREQKIEFK